MDDKLAMCTPPKEFADWQADDPPTRLTDSTKRIRHSAASASTPVLGQSRTAKQTNSKLSTYKQEEARAPRFVSLMFLETPFVLVHVLEMIKNTHEDRISRECSFFCIPQKCTSLFVCPFSFKKKMERKKIGGSTTIEFFFQSHFSVLFFSSATSKHASAAAKEARYIRASPTFVGMHAAA